MVIVESEWECIFHNGIPYNFGIIDCESLT